MSLGTSAWSVFAAVAAAHALAVVSPGPDFALVVKNTVAHGRRAGLATAAGIGSGIVIHVAYGLFGLGAVLRVIPGFLQWLGVLAAATLCYLGISALRPRSTTPAVATAPVRQRRCYLAGLATNALNPKAVVFFVALFAAVIASGVPIALKLLLAVWLPLATFAWFALLSLLLGQQRLRDWLQAHAPWIERAMGVLLLALGVLLGLTELIQR